MAVRLNSPDAPGVLHFVTLNIRERKKPFRRREYAALALSELRQSCDRCPALLVAYVAMPDHLHFVVAPRDGKLSLFLCRFKPAVTRELDALALSHGRQREREWLASSGRRELWQDGKYSLPLFSPQWVTEKINYIHFNPVRAELVENPGDYPWSSWAAYHPDSGREPPVKVDVAAGF